MITDVVAILDSGYSQLFAEARAIKATVTRASKSMEHPLETGAVITDHRIILPTIIDLSLIVAEAGYPAVYQSILDAFREGTLLTVQTRVDTYFNMIIDKMPHDEATDLYDGVSIALTLKEVQIVEAKYATVNTVRNPADASTKKRGTAQGKDSPPERETSILGGIF